MKEDDSLNNNEGKDSGDQKDSDDLLTEVEKNANQVKIYLDERDEPIITYRPPVKFELDTSDLEDGMHKLRIEATDSIGTVGTRTVNFEVRNGPGIGVDGIQENDVVDGRVPILVNAYGGATEAYWEPERAETPSPIPTWAWVLLLSIIGWSLFYVARQWNPPKDFASSPTYSYYSEGGMNVSSSGQATSGNISSGGTSNSATSAKATGTSLAKLGAKVYSSTCATCHQANGQGLTGVFPSLVNNPVVTAKDPTRHIQIVLWGIQGKTIEGVDYSAAMPGWSKQLSNKEVAAVINHERTSWGNNAPTVTPEDVAAVRKKGPVKNSILKQPIK